MYINKKTNLLIDETDIKVSYRNKTVLDYTKSQD